LLRKERKERKFMGKERGCKKNGSGDHFLKRESMCNSLVLKRTEKQICFWVQEFVGKHFQSKLINGVAEKMSD
jgi:hypothetical protein